MAGAAAYGSPLVTLQWAPLVTTSWRRTSFITVTKTWSCIWQAAEIDKSMREVGQVVQCCWNLLFFFFKQNFFPTFLQIEAPQQKIQLAAPPVLIEKHSWGSETQNSFINQALHVKNKSENATSYLLCHFEMIYGITTCMSFIQF